MESFPAVSSVTLASSSNAKAIGLISGAHLYSHFYLLLLPPIFPLLQVEFDVSYTALGFLLTVLNVVTGLTQAPVGMLVDRIGARTLLITALVVQSLAFAVMGLVATYPALVAMMVVAGLANAVYH
ncbi:MAG: MFS transporter, partial [Chromatiales bacterium]|nr:MFS transporter [Chromatiales bacterium]